MDPRWLRERVPPPRLLLIAAAAVSSACVSGRILEGYPGYPFLSFTVPAASDSTFFMLQDALEAEGFELDYTERDAGAINTRPSERPAGPLLLTVIVDTASSGASTGASSRVWVAGYRPVPDGARRVNPLREDAWADLREITARVSDRVGGSPPEEPDTPKR